MHGMHVHVPVQHAGILGTSRLKVTWQLSYDMRRIITAAVCCLPSVSCPFGLVHGCCFGNWRVLYLAVLFAVVRPSMRRPHCPTQFAMDGRLTAHWLRTCIPSICPFRSNHDSAEAGSLGQPIRPPWIVRAGRRDGGAEAGRAKGDGLLLEYLWQKLPGATQFCSVEGSASRILRRCMH